MGSALLTMFGLALLCCLGVVHGGYKLIETEDGEILERDPEIAEPGDDYGSNWTPNPYGHKPAPETEPPVTCTWDSWGAWSGFSATCGSGQKTGPEFVGVQMAIPVVQIVVGEDPLLRALPLA